MKGFLGTVIIDEVFQNIAGEFVNTSIDRMGSLPKTQSGKH